MNIRSWLRLVCGSIIALSGAGSALLIDARSPGLAIKGYDPVAYFTEGEPKLGSPDFAFVWEGVRWQFANAAHRALFVAHPEAYAPHYSRFCALSPPLGPLDDIDPEAWAIVDGRLRLNRPGPDQGQAWTDPDPFLVPAGPAPGPG